MTPIKMPAVQIGWSGSGQDCQRHPSSPAVGEDRDHEVPGVVRGAVYFAVAWAFSSGGFEPGRPEGGLEGAVTRCVPW